MKRAGLQPPAKGAHILRHTLATLSLHRALVGDYPEIQLNNNSIHDNDSYNVYTTYSGDCSSITIDAEYNWWGHATGGLGLGAGG